MPLPAAFPGLAGGEPLEVNRLRRRGHRASRVQGAILLRMVICSLLFQHATVLLDPDATAATLAIDASPGAGFPVTLAGLLAHRHSYGAVSTFRRVRNALWPAGFPVYASVMPFPHPSATGASGFMLFTRCLPRSSNELADMSATLGNDYWLGFVISGHSPYKKRLASLGAQRRSGGTRYRERQSDSG